MKKKSFKLVFGSVMLCIFFSVTACSKNDDQSIERPDPNPAFSFEAANDNPQLISFINSSVNAEEFIWDFGDGSQISTQKHPSHLYESPGDYTVSLTAVTSEKTDTKSQKISVIGIPVSDFTFQADPENPLTVHFTNLSENVTEFSWDFGHENSLSTEENPSYTYPETGVYMVTLTAVGPGGTDESTYEIEVDDGQIKYENLYIVGDASLSEWNISDPKAFTRHNEDPFIFDMRTSLSPGNLKFSTFTGNWCDGEWINAPVPSQPITVTGEYIITQGCDGPDNQWTVTEETKGKYNIRVNLSEESVSFEKLTPEYSGLYLVGDASASGWDIASPVAFEQSQSDPFIFTYNGDLKPGNLKISTFTGNWCDGEWLNASQPDQPLVQADYIITSGCDGPDNQWIVDSQSQGSYLITVDLFHETIIFEKL